MLIKQIWIVKQRVRKPFTNHHNYFPGFPHPLLAHSLQLFPRVSSPSACPFTSTIGKGFLTLFRAIHLNHFQWVSHFLLTYSSEPLPRGFSRFACQWLKLMGNTQAYIAYIEE